jgi:hypothetical protein
MICPLPLGSQSEFWSLRKSSRGPRDLENLPESWKSDRVPQFRFSSSETRGHFRNTGTLSKHGDSPNTGTLQTRGLGTYKWTGTRNADFLNTGSQNLQMDGESERGLSEHGESERGLSKHGESERGLSEHGESQRGVGTFRWR